MPRRDFTKIAFADTGDKVSIPSATQPDGSVSVAQGYGFDYERDNGAGGGTPDPLAKNIEREDMNGILNEITASIGEIQQNGFSEWVLTAAPYPVNATVRHNGVNWRSDVTNNSDEPGAVGITSWVDTTAVPTASGLVGAVRNGRISLPSASASATFTADEVIVKQALGGRSYSLPSFNKSLNLATVGAGGMDVGAAPAAGYVAIYAIYNPATGVSALLARNTTALLAGSVYGGANMPAGYTASALVGVWPTASSILVAGFQVDRRFSRVQSLVLNTSVQQASLTTLAITSAVPPNAKMCSLLLACTASVSSSISCIVAGSPTGIGQRNMNISPSTGLSMSAADVPLIDPQNINYIAVVTAGTMSLQIYVTDYTF